jgi:hypothetical protein
VAAGGNVTTDLFYAAQGASSPRRAHPSGRFDPNFEDHNSGVLDAARERCPGALSCEMETALLLHMAARSKGSLIASAACIAIWNRVTSAPLARERIGDLEMVGGRSVLEALAEIAL